MYLKDENKEKEAGDGPFLKRNRNSGTFITKRAPRKMQLAQFEYLKKLKKRFWQAERQQQTINKIHCRCRRR